MRLISVACLAIILAGCASKNNESTTEEPPVDAALAKTLYAGEVVYIQYCATCHMSDGSGAAPMNPPLIKTSRILGDKDILIDVIVNGLQNAEVEGKKYNNAMPSFSQLKDDEIASVLTFIRNSFGNKADMITIEDVTNFKNHPKAK